MSHKKEAGIILGFNIPEYSKLWMLTFWMMWVALLLGGFLFGEPEHEGDHRIPAWARMGSSLMLVLAAWSWWLIADFTNVDHLALLFAVGMSCAMLGDLFMAELITKSDQGVLGGIVAFGVGHTAYIAGLLTFAGGNNLDLSIPPIVVCWVLAVILWYLIVFRTPLTKQMQHYAALPYGVLLATTAGIGLSLAIQSSEFVLLGVGGLLFLLSDLLVAAHLFNHLKFPLLHDLIWLTYGPGQMLLIFTIPFQSILG